MRVAIIGAGPSGLAQLRAFAQAEEKSATIPELVCYERQADWGGVWNFTWRTGIDEHGEPVHTSTYRNLWSNAPKECLEFADYTFDEHFAKPMPSFLPRELINDYITGRAAKSNIRRFIKFSTAVRCVHWDCERDQFNLRSENLITNQTSEEYFDYVIVAVGHFSVPHTPYFDGIETFKGRVVHSHDFRDARHFTKQRILVIGGGLSAEDIALQTYKYGAKSITISYRTKPFNYSWPEQIEELPLLTRIDGNTVYFPNGITRDFDSIVICTGYKHHFPFLSGNLRLATGNRLYPDQLYKGVVFNEQPRLLYIGMQKFYYSLPFLDAQAWYARDVILSRIPVPQKEERIIHMKEWQNRERNARGLMEGMDFLLDYARELLEATDYPVVNYAAATAMFRKGRKDKEKDILSFRDKTFTSAFTGTTSVSHHVPWIQARDVYMLMTKEEE